MTPSDLWPHFVKCFFVKCFTMLFFTQASIFTRCLEPFWLNLHRMIFGPARRCHMTFMTSHVLKGALPAKMWFFYKMLVLQITLSHFDQTCTTWSWGQPTGVTWLSWSHMSLREHYWQKCHFLVKCYLSYRQHAMMTWLGQMTRHWPVSMGYTQIWGQRSLRGHFRFECQNPQNASSPRNNMEWWRGLVTWLGTSQCLLVVHRFEVKGH